MPRIKGNPKGLQKERGKKEANQISEQKQVSRKGLESEWHQTTLFNVKNH